ncbi:MAG TPA: phosphotransferase [Nocardioidaceae bacterium]|nr:phosphotransferase [Nocardioidaceae bacterium]
MTESPWRDPDWLRTAYEWIELQLGRLGLVRTGDIEQPHVYVWSTVMRVPTDQGDVWFKANMDVLRHEAAVASLLSADQPDLVAPPLAVDLNTGWMLMSDAGRRLREVIPEERSLHRWLDVLPRYAELQIAFSDRVDELLDVGVPDLRMATLPAKYERLVTEIDVEQRFRDAVPHVRALCERLSEFGVPETIQHDDLHDGQVFVRDGSELVMDWGDACVSHPFFTLSVTLEGVIAWGLDDEEDSEDLRPYRDAYLAPFAARFDGDLAAAVDVALRLGWAARAVNGHVPGDDERTRTRLRMFLDGKP